MSQSRLLSVLAHEPVQAVAKLVATTPALKTELDIHEADIARTGVLCPVIQEEIVVPCALTACVFYSDLGRCHNCALVYANHQGEDFGITDLAILYRKPMAMMGSVVEGVLAKLRTEMHADKEIVFEFVPLAGVCTCCEAPIEEEIVRDSDLDYCSAVCALKLPPEAARRGYLPSNPLSR